MAMNWSSVFSQLDDDRKALFLVNCRLNEREEKLLLKFMFSSVTSHRGLHGQHPYHLEAC